MELVPFIAASVLLTLSPGPDILFVLSESISRGSRAGIFIAVGLCSGLIVHTTAAATGASILLRQNEVLFTGLKVFGAMYLVYLAWMTIRTEWNQIPSTQPSEGDLHSGKKYFIRGFTMNVLNPKVTLFFLAFLPQFTTSESIQPFWQIWILGLIFMAQALIIFGSVAVLSGFLKPIITRPSAYRVTLVFKIAVLLFIAFQILLIE